MKYIYNFFIKTIAIQAFAKLQKFTNKFTSLHKLKASLRKRTISKIEFKLKKIFFNFIQF